MSTLSRWLLRRFFKAYLTLAATTLLVFLAIDGLVNLRKLLAEDFLARCWQRYGHMLPEIYYLLSPFLILMAGLWVVAGLRRAHELTVLQASGCSPRQLALPLLAAALLLAAASWLEREWLLPAVGALRLADARGKVVAARPLADASGGVLSGHAYVLGEGVLREARYVRFGADGGEAYTVLAEEAQATPTGWRFCVGVAIARGEEGAPDAVQPFAAEGLALETSVRPRDFEALSESRSFLSAAQLREQIARSPAFQHLEVQFYERYAQPLAGLALLVVSLPLVLDPAGRALLRFFGAVLLAGGYFVLSAVCFDLGGRRALPPVLAAFAPLACSLVVAGLLRWRLSART
ncbi:MAG: LptF/LptG family permease [Planctomycetota bacterium]|nr:MAG: LptF/LptG family permease [Planctomycetota bacterium]